MATRAFRGPFAGLYRAFRVALRARPRVCAARATPAAPAWHHVSVPLCARRRWEERVDAVLEAGGAALKLSSLVCLPRDLPMPPNISYDLPIIALRSRMSSDELPKLTRSLPLPGARAAAPRCGV